MSKAIGPQEAGHADVATGRGDFSLHSLLAGALRFSKYMYERGMLIGT
jgi:hypothetical protein